MFDLNAAIADWRHRMSAQPDFQAGDIDELEDHLREAITELTAMGLPEEEAFLVAGHRIGDPSRLAGEFAAADPRLRRRLRLRWIIMGGLAVMVLMALADLIGAMSFHRFGFLPVQGILLGWGWAGMHLLVLIGGGFLVWRLMTGDHAARRIGGYAVGLAAVLMATLAALWLLGRPGLWIAAGPDGPLGAGVVPPQFVPVISKWTRIFLEIMPVLLLIGLLRLVSHRPHLKR